MTGEIRIDHAPVVNRVIEYRKPGKEWLTWAFLLPHEKDEIWRKRLPGIDHRGNLRFQLVRRTAVITDEVLDTEGE